jgi:hypothetical protein
VKLLALTLDERAIMLSSLEDPPKQLAELRALIARMMGTSIEQIEKTYGHLLPDALDRGRAALEALDAASAQPFRRGMGAAD